MKKRIIMTSLIVILSLVLSCIYWIICNIDGDLSFNFYRLYKHYNVGIDSIPEGIKTIPLILATALYPSLGIHELVVSMEGIVSIFICSLLTLLLLRDSYNHYSFAMIALAFFLILPNKTTDIFHLFAGALSLFIIYMLDRWGKKQRIIYALLAVLSIVCYYFVGTDFAIAGIYAIIPSVIFFIIEFWNKKEKRGKITFIIAAVFVILCGTKIVISVLEIINGRDMPLIYSGYGGEDYANWGDPSNIVNLNVGYYFRCLVSLWNSMISGSLVQFDSFIVCVRIMLLIIGIVIAIKNCIEFVKHGTDNMDYIECLCSIEFAVISFTNIINGVTTALNGVPRYASIAPYLLTIILIKKLSGTIEQEDFEERFNLSCNKVKAYLTLLSLCSIVLFMPPIYKGKSYFESYQSKLYGRVAEQIISNNNCYGVADWSTAAGVFVKSQGKCKTTAGRLAFEDKDYINEGVASDVRDGCNFYNYIIANPGSDAGFEEDNIKSVFGEPIKEYPITNADGYVESNIMVYDYDVRWKPEYFYCYDNEFAERPISLGITRLIVTGHELTDAELFFKSGIDIKVDRKQESNERVIFDIYNYGDNFVDDLIISTQGDVVFGIEERVYAGVDICDDVNLISKEERKFSVNSKCTSYRIVLQGEGVGDLLLGSEDDVVIEKLSSGTEHAEYLVDNSKGMKYKLTISNTSDKDVVIKKCAISEKELEFPCVID